MINYCHHPKALPPPPPPTQGHTLDEKALELCHWKQELVFLTPIIKSKERKRQNTPQWRWGEERKPNIYKGLFHARCLILPHISFHSHKNPVEWWFPNLSASKCHWACSLQIQRCESHPQTFCIWLSGQTGESVFLTITSGVSNDQAPLGSPAVNCNVSSQSYRCGDRAVPDP